MNQIRHEDSENENRQYLLPVDPEADEIQLRLTAENQVFFERLLNGQLDDLEPIEMSDTPEESGQAQPESYPER